MRHILDATPKAYRGRRHTEVRDICDASDSTKAPTLLDTVVTEWAHRGPQSVKVLKGAFEVATALLVLPAGYRQRRGTTNAQERLKWRSTGGSGSSGSPQPGLGDLVAGALLLTIH